MHTTYAAYASAVLILAALLQGCAGPSPSRADALPPAPPFHAIPAERLTSAMGQLAAHMDALDRIARAGEPLAEEQREAAANHLDAMELLIDGLGRNALDPHHPQFGWRLPTLRSDLRLARVALLDDPPELYLVGALTGSCTYCHPPRSARRQ